MLNNYMSEGENIGRGEVKIRPSKEFASKLFQGVFVKNNLEELQHLLEKYDWGEFKFDKSFQDKISDGITKLYEIRDRINNGSDRQTDIEKVNELIQKLKNNFFGTSLPQ